MTKRKTGKNDARKPVPSHISAPTLEDANAPLPQSSSISSPRAFSTKSKAQDPSASALNICRNKHWRYISSFHGPWLQLPPEVLQSLANGNYASPRPHPIDPAVFYDLVKIRYLVDEATDLAVRAASGVASSALTSSLNASNGVLGGNGAAALGFGFGGGGGNARLSRERKHRMRELATQKLSKSYHLDEIAASVATMQSASTLEDVAKIVLQRDGTDTDAKYVHFFHEKIPSRMLAQCTSLQPLDEIIANDPRNGEPLRTRAVTRIFKGDYMGAARDLSEALAICRSKQGQHRISNGQLDLPSRLAALEGRNGQIRGWDREINIDEEDQPSSLEPQLLFHRASVYLTIACEHVGAALQPEKSASIPTPDTTDAGPSGDDEIPPQSEVSEEAETRRLEARTTIRTNAKRALRDFISFLSHFDYAPGLSSEITEEFFCQVNTAANVVRRSSSAASSRLLDTPISMTSPGNRISNALVPHKGSSSDTNSSWRNSYPSLLPPKYYQVSTLFSSSPPSDLPPYPSTELTLSRRTQQHHSREYENGAPWPSNESHEAITYHPLLTDALHSLLLSHCLIQTSPKELQRHANMVARLARVCDGYAIFLAARSPSRADWIEVLRRTGNWIDLRQSWEALCAPAPLPGHQDKPEETEEQAKERRREEAIMEALADERVCDEKSFQAAVAARERRAEEASNGGPDPAGVSDRSSGVAASTPKRGAQEHGKEYPISTARAQAIARWVLEAPSAGALDGTTKSKRSGGRKKATGKAGQSRSAKLANSMERLAFDSGSRVSSAKKKKM
ncbi:MAG: hypothetical protein M1837_000401 [Sclerophora amabilis]|nr:MAG: hypothetical protein M1837_000401 [Sclerophora amabilis]